MSHNITVEGGSSVRLKTAGKYCDRDIVVKSTGGSTDTSDATAAAEDIMKDKTAYVGSGKVTGTFTLDSEMLEQDALIANIKEALKGKTAGGGSGSDDLPAGYRRVDYIQFDGTQTVDTGIICNQNTKIQLAFTRERSTQHYLYGVASSDNTASVTAYMGGSWRFGNKYVSKVPTTNADMIYSGLIHKTTVTITGNASAISGVNDFETVGSLLLGACRNSSGTLGASQFIGKIFFFSMWEGTEQVLKLVPVTDGTVYRFYDIVSKTFFDSITDTPLDGSNF